MAKKTEALDPLVRLLKRQLLGPYLAAGTAESENRAVDLYVKVQASGVVVKVHGGIYSVLYLSSWVQVLALLLNPASCWSASGEGEGGSSSSWVTTTQGGRLGRSS